MPDSTPRLKNIKSRILLQLFEKLIPFRSLGSEDLAAI